MLRPDHVFESPDGVIRIARFGPVFAGVYDSPLSARAFDSVLRWQHGVMPEQPIISFSLAFSAHRLEPDVQAAADRLLAAFGKRTAAHATVISAEGFQASAARAALATIFLLTRLTYPRKVFATVAEAEGWLSTFPGYETAVGNSALWLTERQAAGSRSKAGT